MIYPLILSFLGRRKRRKAKHVGKGNKDNQEVEKKQKERKEEGCQGSRGKDREADKEESRAHRGSTLLLFEGQALVILVAA